MSGTPDMRNPNALRGFAPGYSEGSRGRRKGKELARVRSLSGIDYWENRGGSSAKSRYANSRYFFCVGKRSQPVIAWSRG
jgi:hypothetical protein